jgi:hypothetical protein
MRKLFIIVLFFTVSLQLHAQHIYTNNTQSEYSDGTWGRQVYSSDDIRITNLSDVLGSGTYKIELFASNESKPYAFFNVKYSHRRESDNFYEWKVINCSPEFKVYTKDERRIEIRSEHKLSLMASGQVKLGAINIFFFDFLYTGMSYILKN